MKKPAKKPAKRYCETSPVVQADSNRTHQENGEGALREFARIGIWQFKPMVNPELAHLPAYMVTILPDDAVYDPEEAQQQV